MEQPDTNRSLTHPNSRESQGGNCEAPAWAGRRICLVSCWRIFSIGLPRAAAATIAKQPIETSADVAASARMIAIPGSLPPQPLMRCPI